MERSLSLVREVVEDLIQRHEVREKVAENMVGFLWEEIVGPAVARIARPTQVRDGILYVKVKSPQWAQELSYMKVQVLENVRERIPTLHVEDVRFTPAWTSPEEFVEEEVSPLPPWPKEEELEAMVLNPSERYTIEAVVQTLSEPEMRERLRRTMEREFKSRRWRLLHGWQECTRCGSLFFGAGERCDFCHMEAGGP